MNHQNLANLTTQYQQAYLVYCYKVMQYLQALAWLTEQQKPQKQENRDQFKPKSASGFKKLSQDSNQGNLDFKPLKHKGKTKANKNLAIESPYEAFGEVDYQLGSIENKYLFTGEQYDNNVGFYYLRARFYNPGNGRFVNMDTFPGMQFEPATLHKYLYAHGNPINNTDPSGNISIGGLLTGLNILGNLTTYAQIGFKFILGDPVGAAKDIFEEVVWSKLGYLKPVAGIGKKLKNLFGRIWSRGKNYRLGETATSGALRHNLLQNGVQPIPGYQAHHIVGGAYAEGRAARAILKSKKIDVNSATNGVYLPGCGIKPDSVVSTIHCGKHAKAYEALILRRIQQVGGANAKKSAIVNVLREIRTDLLNGTLRLNKR